MNPESGDLHGQRGQHSDGLNSVKLDIEEQVDDETSMKSKSPPDGGDLLFGVNETPNWLTLIVLIFQVCVNVYIFFFSFLQKNI